MQKEWENLSQTVQQCILCPLCQWRTHTVLGEGNLSPTLMLVGEGPGQREDESGRPFVGPAGQLLDQMLSAIGLTRDEVYIANVVKCRPPQNRTPAEEEAMACLPFLRRQFLLLRPKVILCLGATPSRYLISPDIRIFRDHGLWIEKKGVWFMPTFHPSALLRNQSLKRDAWEDWKKVRNRLKEPESVPNPVSASVSDTPHEEQLRMDLEL